MSSPSQSEGDETTSAGEAQGPAKAGPSLGAPVGVIRKLLAAKGVGSAAVQSVLLQLLTIFANLFTGVITARLLGANGRGLYAAAITWPSLLGMVSAAGSGRAVLVYLRRRPNAAAAVAAWGAIVTLGLASLLAAQAFVAMPFLLGQHQQAALQTARAALVFAHVTALGVLFRSVFAGRGRFLLANLSDILPHALHAAAVCAFALGGALTVATAVASPVIGAGLSLALLFPFFLQQIRGAVAELKHVGSDLRNFAWRAAPADLFALMSGWADRLLLIVLVTPRELGFYVVAYGFSRVVNIATPATGILLSAMSHGEPKRAKQLHDMALRFSIASLSVALFVVYLLDTWLIRLFYGAQFLAAAPCFEILVLQAATSRIAGVTAEFYLASDRPALNSWVGFAEVSVSSGLIVALAPTHGAQGAAMAMLIGAALRLGLLWIGLVTHLRLSFPRLWPGQEDVRAIRALFKS